MSNILKELYIMYKIAKSGEDWVSFIKEKYEGGKKRVPNTNPETKDQYSEVSTSTLYKNDANFKNKLQKEFEAWKTERDRPSRMDRIFGPKETKKKFTMSSFKQDLTELFGFDPDKRIEAGKIKLDARTKDAFKARGVTKYDVYNILGLNVLDDVSASMELSGQSELKDSIEVEVKSDLFQDDFDEGFRLSIAKDSVIIKNLNLKEKGKGIGTKILASQIYQAKKMGLSKIKTFTKKPILLAKMGFDTEIPDNFWEEALGLFDVNEVLDNLSLLGYKEPHTVSQVLSLPDNTKVINNLKYFYIDNPRPSEFDLSDDSPSMKTFLEYMERKKPKPFILLDKEMEKTIKEVQDKFKDDFDKIEIPKELVKKGGIEINKHLEGKFLDRYKLVSYLGEDARSYTDFVYAWQGSSGSERALMFSNVLRKLGVKGSSYGEPAGPEFAQSLTPDKIKEITEVVRKTYAFQQAFFRSKGIKTLKLYRGATNVPANVQVGDMVQIESRAIASFTANPYIANIKFSSENFFEYDVPVEHVFTSPLIESNLSLNGTANFREDEYILLGSSDLKGMKKTMTNHSNLKKVGEDYYSFKNNKSTIVGGGSEVHI